MTDWDSLASLVVFLISFMKLTVGVGGGGHKSL